jgi:hypothetical protein
MRPTFIRIFDNAKDCEVLINVNAITEIHVENVVRGQGAQQRMGFHVGYGAARNDPDAFRVYRIFVGGVEHTLAANPGSPVMQVLEDIYKNAIKNDG